MVTPSGYFSASPGAEGETPQTLGDRLCPLTQKRKLLFVSAGLKLSINYTFSRNTVQSSCQLYFEYLQYSKYSQWICCGYRTSNPPTMPAVSQVVVWFLLCTTCDSIHCATDLQHWFTNKTGKGSFVTHVWAAEGATFLNNRFKADFFRWQTQTILL